MRLTIDSPTGLQESIERDLREYGEVVVGRLPPESLLKDKQEILKLNNKLELARIELQLTQRLLSYVESESKARVDSLESQVKKLQDLVGASLSHFQDYSLVLATLLSESGKSIVVQEALRTLQLQLMNPPSKLDEPAAKDAIAVLKEHDPSLLEKAHALLSSTAAGAAGNLLASWIESLLK